jgi:uncharacterized membrane protein
MRLSWVSVPLHPLDSAATPGKLQQLGEAGVLDPPAWRRGVALATSSPPAAEWARFLSRTLLLLGALLVVSGVIDFFAFNWAKLPAAAKLGGLQGLVGLAALGALRPASAPLVRQVCLLVASLLVGPLLGVFGQTYQTGADPFELFLGWAGLILPWVALGGLPSLWLVFVAVLDTGLVLCLEQTNLFPDLREGRELATAVLIFGVHAAATVVYELLARRGVPGAQGRWWPRLLTATGLTALLAPSLTFVFDRTPPPFALAGSALMAAALVVIRMVYVNLRRDLFQLVAGIGSLIAISSSVLARVVVIEGRAEAMGVLLVGLAVVAQVAAAVWWLRRLGSSHEVE